MTEGTLGRNGSGRPRARRLRRLGTSALLALAVLALRVGSTAGCANPSPATPPRCEGRCLSDPVDHCQTSGPCNSSKDCPAGLGCFPQHLDSRAAPPAVGNLPGPFEVSASGDICRLPTADDMPLDSLVTGFRAMLMDLTPVGAGGTGTYAFNAPAGVNVVSCGLFVCTPEVGTVSRGGDTVSEITNFDECTVASTTFEHSTGAVDLGSPALSASKPALDLLGSCPPLVDPSKPWLVSVLELGCWGYGDTSVIAASLLLPVKPSQINLPDLVVPGCAGKDGHSCVLGDGSFGTCFQASCLSRCAAPQDCLPARATRSQGDAGSDDAASPDVDGGPDEGGGFEMDASLPAQAQGAGPNIEPPVCHALNGLGVCVPQAPGG